MNELVYKSWESNQKSAIKKLTRLGCIQRHLRLGNSRPYNIKA